MIEEHYKMILENKVAFWWYEGRRDLLIKLLKNFSVLETKSGGKFLDVGCGPSVNEILYEKVKGQWFILDNSKHSFISPSLKKDLYKIIGDGLSLPFKDSLFDLCLLLDVIEHIDDEWKVFSEVERVLKNGGYLLISVPAFDILWSFHDEQAGHKRRYNKKRIISLLSKSKLKIVFITYFNALFFVPILLLRKILRILNIGKNVLEINLSPKFLNPLFTLLLKIENFINLKIFRIPFGSSLIVLIRKDDD